MAAIIRYVLLNPDNNKILSIIIAVAVFSLVITVVKRALAGVAAVFIILLVFNMLWGNILSEANLVKVGVDCSKVPCSQVVRVIKDNSEKFKDILGNIDIDEYIQKDGMEHSRLQMEKYINKK